jgi:ATP-binding cassette subfamily B protein
MFNKFPFSYQHDAMDCGPACIQMVSNYYGRNYTLQTLREMSYTSREGVSLMSISETAEKLGFFTVAGRFTFQKLVKDVSCPFIIHWKQNHFVVVFNIEIKRSFRRSPEIIFHIADPAAGLIKYTEQEFIENWISTKTFGEDKGIALLLKPIQDFYISKGEPSNKTSIRFIASYFLRYRKYFGQILLGLIIGSILMLIFPFFTQSIVDIGITNQNIGFIYLILVAQLALFISRASVDFIRSWILLHISSRINVSLISDFIIKLMKLPMSFFDTKLVGDLLQRLEDHNRIERFLTAQSLSVIFSLFMFFVFNIVLLIYNTKILTIFLIGSILNALWILLFLRKRRRLDHKLFKQKSLNLSKIYQLINGMQEIKLQNCEKRKRWEWEDVQADLFKVNMSELALQQYEEAGSIFINEIKNIIITIVAATAVINGQLTLGMMLAVQYIIGQLANPVEQIVGFIHNAQDVSISLSRINEIHQIKEEEPKETAKLMQIDENNKAIIILNVTFQYEGVYSAKVLNNIDFTIPHGKVTAIVGTSGSGKTTLIKLLLGYYKPTDGAILIGNHNLNVLDLKWWRSQCGAVMQDGFIFSESIARNIAITDDEIDSKRLLHAARISCSKEFISSLPLSYNTIVGQEGQGLSQGQKQRILIARAVYKNPEFIFLDEATNALDANNEKIITENLTRFYEGKTVVVVAHRLSTVKNADQIVVIDKGQLIETGTHETLSAKKGAYYDLVKNQLELGN